jgi:hypothetical protein
MHRFEIPNPVRPQPYAKFLERIPNPNQSHCLQRPPTENHSSEAIIGGVETAAGAFALVLESDAPIGLWMRVPSGLTLTGRNRSNPRFLGLSLPEFMPLLTSIWCKDMQSYANENKYCVCPHIPPIMRPFGHPVKS